jgi:hypothetical protein
LNFGQRLAESLYEPWLSFAAAASMTLGAFAGEWPQWRGPNRDGISAEKVNVTALGAGAKILWRASVGTGFSSIVSSHWRIYTTGNVSNQDTVWCLDAAQGKPIWRYTYPAQLGPNIIRGVRGRRPQ